jgi:hypothetical protein
MEGDPMYQPDSLAQQQEFTRLYASMSDEQLLELHDDYDDLSEIAQPILRDELHRRKLWQSAPAAQPEKPAPAPDDGAPLPGDTEELLLDGVIVGILDNDSDVGLASYILEQAKIPSIASNPKESFGIRRTELRVSPEDADRAAALLAQPVTASMREEYQAMLDAGDFVLPACPACGSTEILLESTEPTNHWLCDACGHHWQDASSDS